MALSIGTLVGYLSLDDSNFNRKADQADRKINALKLHLDALKASNPKISVEVDAQTKQLDELKAKIAELKAEAAKGVDVRVQMTQAMIELDRVQAKLRSMHNAEIKVNVDDRVANAKLDALKAKVDSFKGPSMMTTAILGLGPALLPVITAATGGLAAIGSGAVAAAGGVGVLRLALTGIGSDTQALLAYKKAMDMATTAKQRQAAKLALEKSSFGGATQVEQSMARFLANVGRPALMNLQAHAQAALFPGMKEGLRELINLLPTADRMVSRFGGTLGTMATEAGAALNSPFWHQFFDWLGKTAQTDLPLIGSIFGHTFEGIARTIQRFSPQGTSLLQWVDSLARRFDAWTAGGKGSGFEQFMHTVTRDGHAVAGVLRPLVPILSNLGKGLNSAGVTELKGIGWGLAQIAKIPPGPLQKLGEALPAIVLGLKGISMVKGLGSAVAGLRGLAGLSLGRLGGTVAGEAGSVALGRGVVPVFVTNKGFGGGGLGGAAEKPAGLAALAASLLPEAVTLAVPAAISAYVLMHPGPALHPSQHAVDVQNAYNARPGYQMPGGTGWKVGVDSATSALKNYTAAAATANRATAAYRIGLQSLPAKVQTAIQQPGAIQSMADIKALAKQYDLTPRQVKTVVNLLGGAQAIATAAAIQQKLDALHSKDITVRVNEIHATSFGPHAKAVAGNATGGHIVGPGTATSDSIPARLSNGEYVIRAAAVAKYGVGLFNGYNSMRFANGGHVKMSPTQRRIHALQQQLAALQRQVAGTNALIGNANMFGDSFAGNVFGAGLPTTKTVNVPGVAGHTVMRDVNGQTISEWVPGTAATTKTVDLSQKQILAEMLGYQRGQMHQAQRLARDVKKLKREGISKSLLAQMQAGGAQGVAEIHALASGSRAQVRQFNSLNSRTNTALANAGAYAEAGHTMASLQNRKANEQSMERAIRKALHNLRVEVKHSHLRVNG